MSETLNQISELVKSFQDQRKVLVEKLRNEFSDIFTEVFEKTDVGCFYWTQYTPYFNDGDTCEFSVGEISVLVKEEPEGRYWEDCEQYPNASHIVLWKQYLETDEVPSNWMNYYPTDKEMLKSYYKCTRREKFEKDYAHKFKDIPYNELSELATKAKLIQDVLDALRQIPDDMYADLFGDHVSVTVNRTGVHINDYDHD